jgi:transcriptional regulator with XRE-family HTH domain
MECKITFGKCLNELLLARGWSSAQLSREISTDASYIRRWIRGERVPSLKSEFIAQIAYSLSYDIDKRGGTALRSSLLNSLTEMGFSFHSEKPLREILTECLTASQIYSLKLSLEERKKRSSIHDDNIRDILRYSRLAYESSASSFPIMTDEVSHSAPYGFLQGRKTVLKTIISMLNEASNSDTPEEILLTFQGDYDISERSDLNKEWNQAFISVLQRGWNIRHLMRLSKNMNRSFKIISKIFHWMGYKGKYEPSYFSKYGTVSPAFELIIIKNIGALVCFNSGENEFVDTGLYIRRKEALEALTSYFNKLAANTQPLVNLLCTDDYFAQTTVKEKTPGDHYICFHDFHTITYPYKTWYNYLHRTISDPIELKQHTDRIKSRLESFYDQVNRYRYRIICPAVAIEYLVKSSRYYTYSKYRDATKEDIVEHLKHLIKLLETYPNFEFALLDENQMDLLSPRNWEVKGESSVFMSLYPVSDMQCEETLKYISISEGTIASSFKDYYNDLWERITPRCKDKTQVIAWLKRQMTILSRNYG